MLRKLTNEEAAALLADANEEWKAFWFSHGAVAKNLGELAGILGTMTDEQFTHHVNPEKNDLAAWVDEVIGDQTLAAKLRLLRTQAATHTMVTRRVSELQAIVAPAPQPEAAAVSTETIVPEEAKAEAVAPAAVVITTVTEAGTEVATEKRAPKAKAAKKAPAAKATKPAAKPATASKGSVWSRLLKG